MNASALLAELTRSGVRLEPRGDMLHVSPPPGMDTEELRRKIKPHKAALLSELGRAKELPAGVSSAYTRLARTLAETPSMTFACETLPDEGGDHILMAVAVRGAGYAVLRMPKAKFDGFKLIEMVDRWNREGGNPE